MNFLFFLNSPCIWVHLSWIVGICRNRSPSTVLTKQFNFSLCHDFSLLLGRASSVISGTSYGPPVLSVYGTALNTKIHGNTTCNLLKTWTAHAEMTSVMWCFTCIHFSRWLWNYYRSTICTTNFMQLLHTAFLFTFLDCQWHHV